MINSQIERLKNDSRTLGHQIKKLHKKGKTESAYRLAKKQSFLDAAINQIARG